MSAHSKPRDVVVETVGTGRSESSTSTAAAMTASARSSAAASRSAARRFFCRCLVPASPHSSSMNSVTVSSSRGCDSAQLSTACWPSLEGPVSTVMRCRAPRPGIACRGLTEASTLARAGPSLMGLFLIHPAHPAHRTAALASCTPQLRIAVLYVDITPGCVGVCARPG